MLNQLLGNGSKKRECMDLFPVVVKVNNPVGSRVNVFKLRIQRQCCKIRNLSIQRSTDTVFYVTQI